MGVNLVALLWGFAEATVFFIVPDVWLTYAGRTRLRTGLVACLFALCGALTGGVLMYWWGSESASSALEVLEMLPGINPSMVERVAEELTDSGPFALFYGPVTGTPYKLYAVQASGAEVSAMTFVLVSIPARLARFILITVAAHYALTALARRWPRVNRAALLLCAWTAFYAWYFSHNMA